MNTIPINSLTGVGIAKSDKLAKIGLHTVQDLLLHLPLRYEDRTNFCKIKDLLLGSRATIEGKILKCNIFFGKRKVMICKISDGSGILTIRFFHFSAVMKKNLTTGCRILIYGEVRKTKYGVEMIHPEYWIKNNNSSAIRLQNTLTPIYPATEGVKQVTLRKLIDQALNLLSIHTISELLPDELIQDMMSLTEAIRILHRPPISVQISDLINGKHPAQQRLIFEELLAYNLNILSLRANTQSFHAQPLISRDNLKNKLLSLLPFKLTNAQIRVIAEIERDMTLNVPMIRLIQGEVGSGKTLVSAVIALRAITNGKQVAMMAPTELLAEQHINNFRNWFEPLGIKVGWISGKQKGKARLLQQNAIARGQIQMVVGTHAILQKQIKFHDLALVIIDEQHRFGVHQRFTLWEKNLQHGYYPHQLIMTATPIPRTLAMAIYADLNISIIDEVPNNRSTVNTVIVPDTRRNDIIDRIRYVCTREGRQAYWICTIIKESELLKVKAAETMWRELKLALPELNVGLVHGRMNLKEKQEVMYHFKKSNLHLLVATTVIEVGIDIPNASLMIIENAERFGLSQLHQLRGRVGRGMTESHCVLLYKSPLSKIARKRLQVLRDSNNGFFIAKRDLEIRGPGELSGTRQTGNTEFKIVNLLRDQAIIPKVHRVACHIHEHYPEQAVALIDRWISKIRCYSNI